MSRKRLFLLLNSMGELPQRTLGWDTFDVARIQAEAESRGFDVSCRRPNEFLLVPLLAFEVPWCMPRPPCFHNIARGSRRR